MPKFAHKNKTHKSAYRVKSASPTEKVCNSEMTFQECELAILRNVVDKGEKIKGEKVAQSEEVINMMSQVEDFIRKKKLVCYGGTAVNNILPKYDQFYDRKVDIPDYDFYSTNALKDAKELADIFYVAGYREVEAKAGVHTGTYKVYVNFIPVADITYLHPTLFKSISKEAIIQDGIRYAPPDYLRMAMYLELSRPHGDVSRWEKVLKRINLLNKHYPLDPKKENCDEVEFQRKMEKTNHDVSDEVYSLVKDVFINEGCVFFGGYAMSLYSNYMKGERRQKVKKIPDFDVLAEEPKNVALLAKEQLEEHGHKDVKVYFHKSLGEVIPEHYEVILGENTLAFIYSPIACHSYNTVLIDGVRVNVATIDTLLSFYLAFIYADKYYFDKTRLLCMSSYLFEVQQYNRLRQSGLLKRFTMKCFGKQETLDEIRAKKAKMFKKIKKNSPEYEEWFLKYNPATNPNLTRKSVSDTEDEPSPSKKDISYEVTDKRKNAKTRKNLPKSVKQKETSVENGDTETASTPTPTPTPKPKPKTRKWKKRREGFLY